MSYMARIFVLQVARKTELLLIIDVSVLAIALALAGKM
jgi:hypothetical protein